MRSDRRGMILIVVVLLAIAIGMVAIAVSRTLTKGIKSDISKYKKVQSLYAAHAGIYAAIDKYNIAYSGDETKHLVWPIDERRVASRDNSSSAMAVKYNVERDMADYFLVLARNATTESYSYPINLPVSGSTYPQARGTNATSAKDYTVLKNILIANIGTPSAGGPAMKITGVTLWWDLKINKELDNVTIGTSSPPRLLAIKFNNVEVYNQTWTNATAWVQGVTRVVDFDLAPPDSSYNIRYNSFELFFDGNVQPPPKDNTIYCAFTFQDGSSITVPLYSFTATNAPLMRNLIGIRATGTSGEEVGGTTAEKYNRTDRVLYDVDTHEIVSSGETR